MVKIKIDEKHFWTIIVLAVVLGSLAVMVVVSAGGISSPSDFGHTLAQIDIEQERGFPPGAYCLVQRQANVCPEGFSHGSIRMDTDDDEDGGNGKYGAFPHAYAGANVQMHFCCKSE